MAFNSTDRAISIRANIKLTTGRNVALSASDILSYTVNEQAATSGFVIGGAQATAYELVIDNTSRDYSILELNGAGVTVEIGSDAEDGSITYSPFGVWTIESASLSRQSAVATLKGNDALASAFDAKFIDSSSKYPRTIGAIFTDVCGQAKEQHLFSQ